MKLGLRIERNGESVADLELGPGDHAIGRAPDCDVVLPDRAVSSRHALLRVDEKSAELIDQESLNGIFLDGRKISRLAIAHDLTVDICGYHLRFHPKASSRRLLPALPTPGFRPGVLLATAVLALGVLAAAWIPGDTAAREARQREGLRRGVLLARFLAEQNILPLKAKLLEQVRVTPVSVEDGVRETFVADPYGKILAPPKDMGKALDNPRALRAAQEPGVSLWTEPGGETCLACPIRDGDNLLGVAFITYDPLLAVPASGPAAGLLLGLACAALLWIATATFILRSALRPVRLLAEDIGVALKSGSKALTFRPPSREYAELKQAAERLLILVPAAQPEPATSPDTSGTAQDRGGDQTPPPVVREQETDGQDGESRDIPPAPGPAADGGEDWCLLSLDGYRLVEWSPAFVSHLAAPDMTPPVHLLTALADPALLAALAEAVEDPDPKAARQVQNQPFAVVKRPGPAPGTGRVEISEAP